MSDLHDEDDLNRQDIFLRSIPIIRVLIKQNYDSIMYRINNDVMLTALCSVMARAKSQCILTSCQNSLSSGIHFAFGSQSWFERVNRTNIRDARDVGMSLFDQYVSGLTVWTGRGGGDLQTMTYVAIVDDQKGPPNCFQIHDTPCHWVPSCPFSLKCRLEVAAFVCAAAKSCIIRAILD